MDKADFLVLIVEDDKNLGKALSEFVTRLGFKALHVVKPEEALAALKIQAVHFALIDCMLPKMNGRDLAVLIRKENYGDLPIVLMSGIYKDKAFVKDSTNSSKALAFLTKPFDLEKLTPYIESAYAPFAPPGESLIPIYDLLRKKEMSAKARINAINETDSVHGFDLPWVFSLLLDSNINGHLNLVNADGEVSGVSFCKGQIVQVNSSDPKSYFGSLLVENGFISSADLNAGAANHDKQKMRRIGEHLVELNLVSPHAVEQVIAEQFGIRLSQTVSDTSLKVNFVRSSDIKVEAFINRSEFTRFLDDWINSKLTIDWLKAFYVPLMTSPFKQGPEYSEVHRCLTLPILNQIPWLLKEAAQGKTLEELLAVHEGEEERIYKGIHVLALSRVLIFAEPTVSTNFEPQLKRLQKLNAELEKQNYFERLGLSQKSKDTEVKRSYLELAKVLHPDKLPPQTPSEIKELTKLAFEKVNQAHATLSDPAEKEKYLKELQHGSAELVLQAEALIDEGKLFLGKGDIRKASEVLLRAVQLAPPSTELKLLFIWSQLKTQGIEDNASTLAKIRDQLGAIPPEERHTALFYFVRGLLFQCNGDFVNAAKSVEHAVSIDSDFIEARRELNVIKAGAKANQPVDILKGDLKDVVGLLFKKKK